MKEDRNIINDVIFGEMRQPHSYFLLFMKQVRHLLVI